MICFALLKDNLCDMALDLTDGHLIIEDDLPWGTFCQWLISAQEDDGYVILEFRNFTVLTMTFFE